MNKYVNALRVQGLPSSDMLHCGTWASLAQESLGGHTVEDSPPTVWPSFPQTLTEPLIRTQHYSKHHILHNQLSLLLWNSDSSVEDRK